MEPSRRSGIPINLAENWWLSLTNGNWRDFTKSAAPSSEKGMLETRTHQPT